MEVKKKLKISLNNYGMFLNMVILFMLVLGLEVIFCPTSYAYMTSEYLDYGINTLTSYSTFSNYDSTTINNMRTILNSLNSNSVAKNALLSNINSQFDTWQISNADNYNVFGYCYPSTYNKIYIFFVVCNMSVPGQYTDLDFYLLNNQNLYPYSKNQVDKLYVLRFNYYIKSGAPTIYATDTFTLQSDSYLPFYYGSAEFSQTSDTILTCSNIFCSGIPSGFAYYPLNNSSTIIPVILQDKNGNYHAPEPDPTPTPIPTSAPTPIPSGTITNNSGETTGSINLSGIEQGITGIQNAISGESQRIINNQTQNTNTIVNTISGETQKITNTLTESADNTIDNTIITSGDIESSLGFEIAENPYENFWTTLTTNLENALLGSKRSIDISFQGKTWTISLDEYFVLPSWLTIILIPISTALFTWVLVRQWKLIFDNLASGNIDSILKDNSEEGISNLF